METGNKRGGPDIHSLKVWRRADGLKPRQPLRHEQRAARGVTAASGEDKGDFGPKAFTRRPASCRHLFLSALPDVIIIWDPERTFVAHGPVFR